MVRIGLWSLLGLIVLIVVVGGIAALSFDPDSLKPRIIAAVKQATGRDLTLEGHMRLGLSLRPTLVVSGASLANPLGFSRPQMATLKELDVQLALLPLLSHRVEIDRLVLVKPDIILETYAQGRPNWLFTPETKSTPPGSGTAEAHAKETTRISVADLQIVKGILTWRDGRVGRSAVIRLDSLHVTAASPDADLHLSMSAAYNGTPFTLAGVFGPLTSLEDGQSGAAWPVQANFAAAGAKLAIDGTIAQPMQARGYRMRLSADIPDLAALAPFLPGANLPPARDIHLAAQVADTGAPLPEISSLTLHVGQSDLSGLAAGLKLDKLDVASPGLDKPIQVSAEGQFNGSPATIAGSLVLPASLLARPNATTPVPLSLSVQAAGSNLTIKGTAARVTDGRPSVQADVASDRLDLDSFLAALRQPPGPAPVPADVPATAIAKPPPPSGRVISDTPLPFNLLRLADANLQLSLAQLIWGGASYRAVTAHFDLQGGRLKLEPLSADLPEGHLDAALSIDASPATPTVAIKAQIPALAVQPLLAAMKQPAYITGNVQVQADLRGAGPTPHAIAASLDGSLGLAMVNGEVDNRLLGSTLGSILREINLLDLVGRGGTSSVQCFAARLDAAHGIAAVRSLALASSLLTMDGDGSVNLDSETLDLHLRALANVVGTGLVVPLRVVGSFRTASARADTASAVTQNAVPLAGALLGKTNPLGAIAGALAGKQFSGGAQIDCGAALAAARGTSAAATTTPKESQPSSKPAPKIPNVGGVLKQLFR